MISFFVAGQKHWSVLECHDMMKSIPDWCHHTDKQGVKKLVGEENLKNGQNTLDKVNYWVTSNKDTALLFQYFPF